MNFTKVQIQEIINNLLLEENGLNEILQMTLNAMMLSERSSFLTSEDQISNKGNGYRYAKALGFGHQLTLSVPRDRLGVFKPVILAIIKEQNQLIKELSFNLYSKGLTTYQIGEVLDKIYGKYYSKSSISSISQEYKTIMENWRIRALSSRYLCVYIDAIHIKVRRETVSSEAFYILLGLNEDFTREVIGIVNIPTESATGWEEVLKDLKNRGVKEINLIIADGLKGLDNSIHKIYPKAEHQKCVIHLIRNILNKVKPVHKAEVANELKQIFEVNNQSDTLELAMKRLTMFSSKWGKYYQHIEKLKDKEDIEYYFTYLNYNYKIRNMIYSAGKKTHYFLSFT